MNARKRMPIVLPVLIVLWACSSGPRYAGFEDEPVKTEMRQHFGDAREMRSALILADLEAARAGALALTRIQAVEGLPPGSEPELQEIRDRARAVSMASTLEGTAEATAALMHSCAQCHIRHGAGPGRVFNAQPRETEDRSLNHGVRADRTATLLWQGVLAPADVAWQRGAAQLADGVYIPDILSGRLVNPSQIQEARERLTTLGIRAERTSSPEGRIEILSRVWTECADCHHLVELGGP